MPAFQDPDTYRDILDGLQVGVCVLDLQKKIVFWSDGAEQVTGYARIDVLGHSCTENILLHCNQTGCELCAGKCPISAVLHDARPAEAVNFIHHKSGHRIPVHTWAIPLRNKHGSIIGIIQTFDGGFAVNGPDPNDRIMKQRGWLDDVTGLSNQTMMQSLLQETLGTFADLHISFAVVCLDIHELSQLRARYGQGAATSMLQVLARTLRNTVLPTDFVGRWGESQFLVILCGCTEDALPAVAARMLKTISHATIVWWGEELTLTVSIGSAAAMPGDSVESLLQRAQLALAPTRVAPPEPTALAAAASASESSKKSSTS